MAEGGIVKKRRGGILANIGEGRYDEVVTPLDGKHGLGGDVYLTINAGAGTDPLELARVVTRALNALRQSGGVNEIHRAIGVRG